MRDFNRASIHQIEPNFKHPGTNATPGGCLVLNGHRRQFGACARPLANKLAKLRVQRRRCNFISLVLTVKIGKPPFWGRLVQRYFSYVRPRGQSLPIPKSITCSGTVQHNHDAADRCLAACTVRHSQSRGLRYLGISSLCARTNLLRPGRSSVRHTFRLSTERCRKRVLFSWRHLI